MNNGFLSYELYFVHVIVCRILIRLYERLVRWFPTSMSSAFFSVANTDSDATIIGVNLAWQLMALSCAVKHLQWVTWHLLLLLSGEGSL